MIQPASNTTWNLVDIPAMAAILSHFMMKSCFKSALLLSGGMLYLILQAF